MAWYWIVALCVTSASFGAVLMSLLTMGKIADMQAAIDAGWQMRNALIDQRARLIEEVAQGREDEARIADALHGEEVTR